MSGNLPLVSVPVITYNSSKYVLETLESIKAQTYQNIELIVSDDCSTDNTVEICRDWIEKNKDRFARTELLTSPVNTGISANGNRAEAACKGEWVKGIAGDDLLLQDCIETCVDFVLKHSDVIILFGKVRVFGADSYKCWQVEHYFDYEFFNYPVDKQLHRLLEGNCIPASTLFYHRIGYSALDVVNDERVPLLEDWAKWINLLKRGAKFFFVDSFLVSYRVGGISTKNDISLAYYKSTRLMFFYYQYPEWFKEDPDDAVNRAIDGECACYAENLELKRQLNRIRSSFVYKCYSKVVYPIIKFIKSSTASK